jgi:lipopolysaccharide export system permease protein
MRTLSRYILREWLKVFGVTVLGFPVLVIAIDLAENLQRYLARGVGRGDVLLGALFSVPETMFYILPAAVLFATLFTVGNLGRFSELTAAHASGISFYRIAVPLASIAFVAAIGSLALGELAPGASSRQAELLGERARRARDERYNFVYRAERGWVYTVRELDASTSRLRDVLLERRGAGPEYPTITVQAGAGTFQAETGSWQLEGGALRYLRGPQDETAFSFDSMTLRILTETPEALLGEPKEPEEMRYAELARYIEALERSGGDARKLKVEHALKLAVPATGLIIVLFAAPLAITSPRQGAAWGIAVGLGTTLVFLLLVRLAVAVGASGLMPEVVAAWFPNALFGLAGIVLLARVRT